MKICYVKQFKMDFIIFFLIIKLASAYYVKTAEIKNVSNYEHLQYKHIQEICSTNMLCDNSTGNVCTMRKVTGENEYKEFNSSCELFLRNMCNYPGNEFYIISGGSCSEYFSLRRNSDNTTAEEEFDYYSDNSTEYNGTTKPALRAATSTVRSTLYDIETAYDDHPCPAHCTDVYEPRCVSVNRNFGQYFKFMTFLNHCQGDMYYCKHWRYEFAPPPGEDEMVDDSPLGWSYCGASRYLQFARFSEVTSSMGHYGWLRGDYRYSHIMEPAERARLQKLYKD